jgi:hypothetical protein
MFALKRLGQGVSSRCFNRQVVDLQIRVDILNKFTQLGTAKRWLLHKYLKIRTTLPFVYLCNKAPYSGF